jgi:hypothetical protein
VEMGYVYMRCVCVYEMCIFGLERMYMKIIEHRHTYRRRTHRSRMNTPTRTSTRISSLTRTSRRISRQRKSRCSSSSSLCYRRCDSDGGENCLRDGHTDDFRGREPRHVAHAVIVCGGLLQWATEVTADGAIAVVGIAAGGCGRRVSGEGRCEGGAEECEKE